MGENQDYMSSEVTSLGTRSPNDLIARQTPSIISFRRPNLNCCEGKETATSPAAHAERGLQGVAPSLECGSGGPWKKEGVIRDV